MHVLIIFFTLLFSMSHAASVQKRLAAQADSRAVDFAEMSEPARTRAEIRQTRFGSSYAGSECDTCPLTNAINNER
jgi:hypothetical protein